MMLGQMLAVMTVVKSGLLVVMTVALWDSSVAMMAMMMVVLSAMMMVVLMDVM